MTPRGWLGGRIRAALVAGVVLGVASAASGTTPWDASAHADAAPGHIACSSTEGAFTSTSAGIPGVVGKTRVLAGGRDRQGVPLPPPLTNTGKWQFAWDAASQTRPGATQGVVRLTAHTYPRDGSHGSALGNRLLAELRVGARIEVSGDDGERLCYRVVRRINVRAERSLPGYYSAAGPSRLAILVCSGKRRSPGDWSYRTVWFAEPLPGP